jgi:hypothetical protein
MKVRNLFSVADFQKRYEDGRLQVKTLSGRVLEQKESFPYGFIAKAKTGRVLVFCQGGNFDGFEILPLTADDDTILSKLKENDVAVYTTNNGNIEVIPGGSGKIFMGNDSKNMCALLLGLIDEIKNMVTFGSSTSHSVDPATQIKFETYKNQVKQLFMESI